MGGEGVNRRRQLFKIFSPKGGGRDYSKGKRLIEGRLLFEENTVSGSQCSPFGNNNL